MKIGFVALSYKRQKYFTLLAARAPVGVQATVIARPRLGWRLIKALWGPSKHFPREQVDLHLKRQQINYPILFRFGWARLMMRVLIGWVESIRLRYFSSLFRDLGFEAVGVWNGQKVPYSAVVLAAHECSVPIWYFENGALPGATTIDPQGVNAQSALSRCPGHYPAATLEPEKDRTQQRTDKTYTILVPFQVDSDTQVVVHSPWIPNSSELLRQVASAAASLTCNYQIVVRPHPLARTGLPSFVNQKPTLIRLDGETPLEEQLIQADIVVTMNSTVGLEAVRLGKPVVVTASALYGVRGVVKRAGSPAQLEAAFKDIIMGGWLPSRATSFIEALTNSYCIQGDWRDLGDAEEKHCRQAWQRLLERDEYHH